MLSCASREDFEQIQYTVKSVEIFVSSDAYGSLYRPTVLNSKDGRILYSLDRSTNSIELFSLDSLKYIGRKKFAYNGPNGVGPIEEYYPHNEDSLFILSDYDLSLVQNFDTLLFRLDIHDLPKNPSLFLHPKGTLGRYDIIYEKNTNSIFDRFITKNISRESSLYYDLPVEGKLTLSDTTVEMMKPEFPELYKGGGHFGVLSYLSRTAYDKKFYYTFHVDPNIYVFDRDTENWQIHEQTGFNSVEKLTSSQVAHEDILENLLTNDVYLELLVDPYRKLFYQFVLKGLPFRKSNGDINDPGTKDIVLRVFNQDFQPLGEIPLDFRRYLPVHCFVTEEGLWLNKESPYNMRNREDIIEYDILTIK
jgi:hypothetical protein